MHEKEVRSREALSHLMDRHDRVFLAFGGGKDSLLVAHLCEPWREKVTLLFVNTGFTFPHMLHSVRSLGAKFHLEEIEVDLMRSWTDHGFPASVLPVDHAIGFGLHKHPKMQPWLQCCHLNRTLPLLEFMNSQQKPTAFLHGQKRCDRAPGLSPGNLVIEGVEIFSPLWDWSDDEVRRFILERELPLPSHYDEVDDSLDCWCCPHSLGQLGANYSGWMGGTYPELKRQVLPLVAQEARIAARAVMDLKKILDTELLGNS